MPLPPQAKPYLIATLAVVLAAGGGYLFGRAHGPQRIEVQTKTLTRTVTTRDTQAEEQVKRLTTLLATLQKHTRTERTTVKLPDGTQTTKTVRDVELAQATQVQTRIEAGTTVHTKEVVDTAVLAEAKRTETNRPDWRVGVLVGADVRTILTKPTLVYGAQVERRIAGPFSAGAWGLSSGAAGVSVSFEF